MLGGFKKENTTTSASIIKSNNVIGQEQIIGEPLNKIETAEYVGIDTDTAKVTVDNSELPRTIKVDVKSGATVTPEEKARWNDTYTKEETNELISAESSRAQEKEQEILDSLQNEITNRETSENLLDEKINALEQNTNTKIEEVKETIPHMEVVEQVLVIELGED